MDSKISSSKPAENREPPATPLSCAGSTEIILNSIADGVFTVDRDFRITWFNRAAEIITGIPKDEAIGRPCCEVFRANICETACALRHTLETGKPIVDKPIAILTAEGKEIPISVSTALLKDAEGRVIGGVETFRDLSLVERLRRELHRRYSFGDMVSKSPAMQKLFAILPEIARSESTVLIQGESGTGKEVLARTLHSMSPRARGPFVAVNCGALPDTLLESELFGHVAGAFTDAKKARQGRFALAEGGTLLLDEIGDVSPALQVRLLRVIEERVYEPLGSSKSVKANVRIIAASNKDLEELVERGIFRKDLYYRVNVVKLWLPPLSERREDIPLLTQHFIDRFNRLQDKTVAGLSRETLAVFMHHDWPGNIRELENAIEHAFILCSDGLIRPEHLPEHLRAQSKRLPPEPGSTLKDVERRAIWEALERNAWRRMATARELGIDKNTLRRKMKRYRLTDPSPSRSESSLSDSFHL
ncbi:sigma-54 interaction domain-containing protein [Desulfoglaeba alkanexedens]|jgi:PAS domain S-box-containing protein|uniref:PAS domain-containing protein n=1 Tax=Desulfoglaeba alkanexedens ALDC TaxID=980445 RepID=A0A4P8L4R6_9BACT|nr:sigma 54-interacting transcriptional regulator [Desulfoglaeba alkanexedens]QCQ22723.1 PAS domain-containing protein [Desulfoglaeba alkanexedens ALDC]